MSKRILNPLTNRYIKEGTRTHQILIKAGIVLEGNKQKKKKNYVYDSESSSENYDSENGDNVSDTSLLEEKSEKNSEHKSDSEYKEEEKSDSEYKEEEKSDSDSEYKEEYKFDFKYKVPSKEEIYNMTEEELDKLGEYMEKYENN
jgi:hypothetical protein